MDRKKILNSLDNYQKDVRKIIRRYREKEETWRYTEVSMTLFVIAFFVVFAIRPAVVTISGLVGEIKEKETISLKMKQKINAIIIAKEEYSRYQEKIFTLESFLPLDYDVAQGLVQVAGATLGSGVSLESVNVREFDMSEQKSNTEEQTDDEKKDELDKHLLAIDFGLSGNGNYLAVRDLVNQMTKTRRWVEIDQYQIKKQKDENGREISDVLNLYVGGQMFYWRN